MSEELSLLRADINKFKAALHIYANPDNWWGRRFDYELSGDQDGGKVARDALAMDHGATVVGPMSSHDEFSGNPEAPND